MQPRQKFFKSIDDRICLGNRALAWDGIAGAEDDDVPGAPIALGVSAYLAERAHGCLVRIIETDGVKPARCSCSQYKGVLPRTTLRAW